MCASGRLQAPSHCLLPGLRDFHFSPLSWKARPQVWMAPPEFGPCWGSAWARVPGVRTLLSFGSRSLHARWPCPVGWEGRREESRPLPWAWGGGTLLAPLLLGLSHPALPLTPRLGSGASCGAQALSGPSYSLGRGSSSPSALPLGGEIPGRG